LSAQMFNKHTNRKKNRMEFMWLKKVLMMDSNNTNVSTVLAYSAITTASIG